MPLLCIPVTRFREWRGAVYHGRARRVRLQEAAGAVVASAGPGQGERESGAKGPRGVPLRPAKH